MTNYDYCKWVDMFYGCDETDRIFDSGLASKWVYIKSLAGNTHPHPTLPFGKMSVGAYSGGYSAGYGINRPNCRGKIEKLGEHMKVRGFSHLHHSGTGDIWFFYNYALTTPFYNNLNNITEYVAAEAEYAKPGYYSVNLNDIKCELTVDKGVALHRYTFGNHGGRVAIDFSNNGLSSYGLRPVTDAKLEITSDNEVFCSGTFSGIKLYFCAKAENATVTLFENLTENRKRTIDIDKQSTPFGAVFDSNDDTLILRVSYSTVSFQKAHEELNGSTKTFDDAVDTAYGKWNETLSAFDIKTDNEELKTKFYSNLYHSLIKPTDMTGENILGVCGDTVAGFSTFWDQYKTQIPLIFLCYKDMGEKIIKALINISRSLNKIPCNFNLSDIFPCEEQAKMLGVTLLCEAYRLGIGNLTEQLLSECFERELARDDYKQFLETGTFERYTHIIDVADACQNGAEIINNETMRSHLQSLAEKWRNAYGQDGLMSENSLYYEGDRYTYSFRLQKNIEERIALAGGKEKYAKMLDSFFGFDESDNSRSHKFQGFNNECDMETPYSYIYADRHDRLCKIINECVNRSFGLGRAGIPGNNDSGGMSSCFLWNTLGLFPVSGSGVYLLGCPQIDSADIKLHNGNMLKIRVRGVPSRKCRYVDKILLNGSQVQNFAISANDVLNGGTLEFFIK